MPPTAHPPANPKTIKLSKGKHSGPEDGACVMELASMLAGEPFSDHPQSVCPVIAALLRTYNDVLDDERRQDLYRYASEVVGTRRGAAVEQARVEHCLGWARERWAEQPWWRRMFRPGRLGAQALGQYQAAAQAAVRSVGARNDASHAALLDLAEQLCALGGAPASELPVPVPAGLGSRSVVGTH